MYAFNPQTINYHNDVVIIRKMIKVLRPTVYYFLDMSPVYVRNVLCYTYRQDKTAAIYINSAFGNVYTQGNNTFCLRADSFIMLEHAEIRTLHFTSSVDNIRNGPEAPSGRVFSPPTPEFRRVSYQFRLETLRIHLLCVDIKQR